MIGKLMLSLVVIGAESIRSRNGVMTFFLFLIPAAHGFLFDFPINDAEIQPVDPYILENEHSFTLDCKLSDSYQHVNTLSSLDMFWKYKNQILENSAIINSSAIRLRVDNISSAHSGPYHCHINETSVNGAEARWLISTDVQIGNKPEPIDEIRCWSDNWQDLTCDWCPEHQPPRLTRWTLYYQIDQNGMIKCQHELRKWEDYNCGCHWPEYDNLYSFKQGATYHIEIQTKSPFLENNANNYSQINTSSYSIVKPHAVREERVEFVNSSSICLSWRPADGMESVDKYGQLLYFIYVTSEYGDHEEEIANYTKKNITLTGLRPYTMYTIKIRCKTVESKAIDLYWSNWTVIESKTLAAAPSVPPPMPSGSFKWLEMSATSVRNNFCKLQIFWQEIAKIDRNGPIKEYLVSFKEDSEDGSAREEIIGGHFYSMEEEVSCDKNHIVSVIAVTQQQDDNGPEYLSPPSQLYITKYRQKLEPVYPVIAETTNHSTIVFQWQSQPADNFTFFHCVTRVSDVKLCAESPSSVLLYGTSTQYVHEEYDKEDSIEGFALAMNKDLHSSGLSNQWIPVCKHDAAPAKPTFAVTAKEERSLSVEWSRLPCDSKLHEGLATSYNITWTDGQSTGYFHEKAEMFEQDFEIMIPGLKPYTSYNVSMTALSRAGAGLQEQHTAITRESKPSMPLFINLSAVTHSEMTIQWEPPASPNGVIMQYRIQVYGGTDNKTEATEETSITVNGLDGFTNYSVFVFALNSAGNSEWPEAVVGKTLIKAPGEVSHFTTEEVNETSIRLSWGVPVPPNGPILGYLITSKRGNQNKSFSVPQNQTSLVLGFGDCGSDPESVTAMVSALTTDEKGNTLIGETSDESENKICGIFDYAVIYILAAVFVFIMGVIVVYLVICFAKKKYLKISEKLLISPPEELFQQKIIENITHAICEDNEAFVSDVEIPVPKPQTDEEKDSAIDYRLSSVASSDSQNSQSTADSGLGNIKNMKEFENKENKESTLNDQELVFGGSIKDINSCEINDDVNIQNNVSPVKQLMPTISQNSDDSDLTSVDTSTIASYSKLNVKNSISEDSGNSGPAESLFINMLDTDEIVIEDSSTTATTNKNEGSCSGENSMTICMPVVEESDCDTMLTNSSGADNVVKNSHLSNGSCASIINSGLNSESYVKTASGNDLTHCPNSCEELGLMKTAE